MSRKYCMMIGLVALLITGCEEDGGSAGGGGNHAASPKPPAAAPPSQKASNSASSSGGSGTFLASPSLAAPPPADKVGQFDESATATGDGSSAPTIALGPVTNTSSTTGTIAGINLDTIGGTGPVTTLASNDDARAPSANAVANPEPVTAMLSLMGLGALSMSMRRRAV